MSLWTGWKSKPPQGTPLDPDSFYAHSCTFAATFNEGSGPPNDTKNGTTLKLGATTQAPLWTSLYPWGPALKFTHASNMNAQALALGTMPSTGFSIAVGFQATATNSNFAVVGTYLTIPVYTSSIFVFNSTEIQAYSSDGTAASWTGLPSNVTTFVNGLLTFDGTNATWYANGVNHGISTALSGKIWQWGPVTAGNTGDLGTQYAFDGWISYLFIFNTVIPPSAATVFTQNPWQIFAPQLPFWWGTQTAGGGTTLSASPGSFNLTGEPATFALSMASSPGTFALTGEPALFGIGLPAGVGSFALTGEPATFGVGLPAAPGTFALTGESATLSAGNVLAAGAGVFNLTGEPATFAVTIPAAPGSFALTGEAATFTVSGNQILAASPGVFSLTGESATFSLGMAATHGTFAMTGEPAAFTVTLGAGVGTFVLTGESATLTSSSGTILAASPGVFALTGEAATFALGLAAAPGSFALAGKPAALGIGLPAAPGSFVLTGELATFGLSFSTLAGSFALTGEPATLTPTGGGNVVLAAAAGVFVFAGQPATFTLVGPPAVDPRLATIASAYLDPRSGVISTAYVDPRAGTNTDPDTDPAGVDPRGGTVIK